MEVNYFKEPSRHLSRDMEFKVYGTGGRPILMFPTMDSRFFQYEDFGMIDAVSEHIESGRIQVFTADSIDSETVTNYNAPPEERLQLYEKYILYVVDELLSKIHQINGTQHRPITAGCSMGGYHAANIFFRHPDLFDGVISLSGLLTLRDFYQGHDSKLLQHNCPLDYLKYVEKDSPKYGQYLRSRIILCCGQGDFEERMVRDIMAVQPILDEREIPAFVDMWGHDVNHDWPWWKQQLPYFLRKLDL